VTVVQTLLRREGRSARGRAYLIRPTSSEDAAALVALRDAVAAEEEWIAGRPGERTAVDETLALAGLVAHGGLSLSLEVENRVVGHLEVQLGRGHEAHIGELAMAVAREYRDERLGRALLETAVEWARAVGLRKLSLGVFPGNARAIALYRSVGFLDEGLRRAQVRVEGRERDLLLMGLLFERP